MSETITSFERDVLLAVQEGLPLCDEPYQELAAQLGAAECEVIDALASMQQSGVIRRIGLVPNHYALGYRHNLMLVWNIDDAGVDQVGEAMGSEASVSHCYRRPRHGNDWLYNLFTMIHCQDEGEIAALVERLQALAGEYYRHHTALKSTRILKKTGLRLKRDN